MYVIYCQQQTQKIQQHKSQHNNQRKKRKKDLSLSLFHLVVVEHTTQHTPFGTPVEPLVYTIKDSSSASRVGRLLSSLLLSSALVFSLMVSHDSY
mmetsp:Transcript_3144/g.3364  ORF Transcript_3144/g.3364 Transcript_3144/m.3364 type:complete len:95 (+) Transcript_3144:1625-1909(+)